MFQLVPREGEDEEEKEEEGMGGGLGVYSRPTVPRPVNTGDSQLCNRPKRQSSDGAAFASLWHGAPVL